MDDESRIERRRRQESVRKFALATAGYIGGHGILRFFAAFLVGLNDSPRAALVERWIPLWNAVGFFLLAWGSYHLVVWLGTLGSSAVKRRAIGEITSLVATEPTIGRPKEALEPCIATPRDWKSELKDLQKQKNVAAILDLRKSLSKTLSKERTTAIDLRLGRWFTKHFQHMLMNGRAAEIVEDVELTAAFYADSDEFGYFREILPVVRQCAELKQSLQEEEQGD